MDVADIPYHYRDYCAHMWIDYKECRVANPFMWRKNWCVHGCLRCGTSHGMMHVNARSGRIPCYFSSAHLRRIFTSHFLAWCPILRDLMNPRLSSSPPRSHHEVHGYNKCEYKEFKRRVAIAIEEKRRRGLLKA